MSEKIEFHGWLGKKQSAVFFILLISFVQKMSSVYIYNCCIYSNALQANFIMEENTMNPEQKV